MVAAPPVGQATTIVATRFRTFLLGKDGNVFFWGEGFRPQDHIDNLFPVYLDLAQVRAIAALGEDLIFIKNDHTLWQWELGNDTPSQLGTDSGWDSLSGSMGHALALKLDKSLWSWGKNEHGKLGLNQTDDFRSVLPKRVGDGLYRSAHAGVNLSVAIGDGGTLWAWGYRVSDDLKNKAVPIKISGDTDWRIASAINSDALLLRNDGSLWLFDNGRITLLDSDKSWTFLNSALNFSFGIKADGTVWQIDQEVISKVGNDRDWTFAAHALGARRSYGIKQDGSVWSWDLELFGQLGAAGSEEPKKAVLAGNPSLTTSDKLFGTWNDAVALAHMREKFLQTKFNDQYGRFLSVSSGDRSPVPRIGAYGAANNDSHPDKNTALTVRFPQEFHANIPENIKAKLLEFQLDRLDLFFIVQGSTNWIGSAPLVRLLTHYWARPNFVGISGTEFQRNFQMGIFAPDSDIFKEIPIGIVASFDVHIHDNRLSPETSGLNITLAMLDLSFWSVVVDEQGKRAAVTLHWLLQSAHAALPLGVDKDPALPYFNSLIHYHDNLANLMNAMEQHQGENFFKNTPLLEKLRSITRH